MYLFFKILDLPPSPSPFWNLGSSKSFPVSMLRTGFSVNTCISQFFKNVLKRELLFEFDILSSLSKISQYVAHNLKYPYKTPSASNGFFFITQIYPSIKKILKLNTLSHQTSSSVFTSLKIKKNALFCTCPS